jgi:hypothetical protein
MIPASFNNPQYTREILLSISDQADIVFVMVQLARQGPRETPRDPESNSRLFTEDRRIRFSPAQPQEKKQLEMVFVVRRLVALESEIC